MTSRAPLHQLACDRAQAVVTGPLSKHARSFGKFPGNEVDVYVRWLILDYI